MRKRVFVGGAIGLLLAELAPLQAVEALLVGDTQPGVGADTRTGAGRRRWSCKAVTRIGARGSSTI
jgi:hypothetical protein